MLQHKSILKGLLTKRLVISALIYQPPVLSRPPVPTDHEGLHGGQVEGAQVGREPRGPALQLPAGALVLPPPDIVNCTNVMLSAFVRTHLRLPRISPISWSLVTACEPITSISMLSPGLLLLVSRIRLGSRCPCTWVWLSSGGSRLSVAEGEPPKWLSANKMVSVHNKCFLDVSTFYRQLLNFDWFRSWWWGWGWYWVCRGWSWWWYWQCWLCWQCDTLCQVQWLLTELTLCVPAQEPRPPERHARPRPKHQHHC